MQEATESPVQMVYLSFHIASEEYAIPIARVQRVVEFDCLTKVPNIPDCIRGLINLRGSVVPVVDLGLKFGFAAIDLTKWTCIVVVEVELEGDVAVMGLLADAVGRVIETSSEEIDPPPSFGTRIRVDYLTGMVRDGKKFVLILDIDRVLAVDELMAVESLYTPESQARVNAPPNAGHQASLELVREGGAA